MCVHTYVCNTYVRKRTVSTYVHFPTKDDVDVSWIPESQATKMAADGMHLPSVGFAMLCAALCLSDVKTG